MVSNQAFFDEQVPQRVQRSLLKSTLENYKESSRYCYRNFAMPQAKDLSGVFRRAKIEDEFSGIGAHGIDLMARFPQIISEYIPKLAFGRPAATRRRRKTEAEEA